MLDLTSAIPPEARTPPTRAPRNFGLDIARVLAVMAVLANHMIPTNWEVSHEIRLVCDYMGVTGVELFFSLSGFLIGQLLIDLAREPSASNVGRFLTRRWMRTLPLYYVALVGMSALSSIWEVRPFFFLQNFQPAFIPGKPVALVVGWSLVLEEWFYLVFPWLLLGLSRSVLRRHSAVTRVAITSLIPLVGCTLLRALLQGTAVPDPSFHAHPILRLDCAAYGVLAACLYRAQRQPVRALSGWILGAGFLAVLVMFLGWGALFVAIADARFQAWSGMATWGRFFFPIQWSVLDLVFAGLVLLLARALLAPSGLIGWTVTTVSRLSYSIYLGHAAVMGFVQWRAIAALGHAAGAAVTLGMIIAAAYVTYALIEQPFLKARDYLVPASRKDLVHAGGAQREVMEPAR